jgi:hypothetical protein
LARWLIGRIVPYLKIGMLQGFFAADTPCRIEAEELAKEVESRWIGLGVEGLKRDLGLDRERADVVLGLDARLG